MMLDRWALNSRLLDSQHRSESLARTSGFTLVELLLATALLLLLLGAVVFSFSTLQRGAELDEGARQVEALIRYSRAQAANSGRQVRLLLEERAGGQPPNDASPANLQALWEPEPLNAPGIYAPLPGAATFIRRITELVRFEQVRSLGEDGRHMGTGAIPDQRPSLLEANDASEWTGSPVVRFYPDGSCDSAEITLGSRNESDNRRVKVRLTGFIGSIRRTVHTVEQPMAQTKSIEPASAPIGGNWE